ncbi:MAG: hypothetical protein MJ198_09430 [Bacteroidales bacterium]|nr:hypothetical protein [Bacteroidales bacterium]
MNGISFKENDELYVMFKYSFESSPISGDPLYYIRTMKVEIIDTETNEIVGKAELKLLLISAAINDGVDLFAVFDSDSYVSRIGDQIFDYEEQELKRDLQKQFWEYGIGNVDICILERLTILPQYRGRGIALQLIRDNYRQLSNSCGLFVMQPYPLQFESVVKMDQVDVWGKQMEYDKMEQDEKKAFSQLKRFYKSCGFLTDKGYPDLMFLAPSKRNDILDKTDF